jgi:cobalt-precorrin 5A hydrolase
MSFLAVGLGLRPGTGTADIRACLDLALARIEAGTAEIGCIATVAARAAEPGLMALAADLGAPVIAIPDEALRGEDAGCATRSTRVVSLYGVGSVAEAAALAAAGPGASLILPRIALGRVTCALARGGKLTESKS